MSGSTPGLTRGQVPTASQWNGYFAVKLDDTAVAVSAAGTTKDDATLLPAQAVVVTVCPPGAGIKAISRYHKIYSRGDNPVMFYPLPGTNFENKAVDVPIEIFVGTTVEMRMTSPTQAYVG